MKILVGLLSLLLLTSCSHRLSENRTAETKPSPITHPPVIVEWTNASNELRAPLKLIRDKESGLPNPVVTLTIDGVSEHFLIDTGAQFTCVLRNFLSRHKHETTDSKALVDSFHHEEAFDIVSLKNMSVDFGIIKEMPAIVTSGADLAYTNKVLADQGHPPLIGILGIDFLVALRTSIDLHNNEIVFRR